MAPGYNLNALVKVLIVFPEIYISNICIKNEFPIFILVANL